MIDAPEIKTTPTGTVISDNDFMNQLGKATEEDNLPPQPPPPAPEPPPQAQQQPGTPPNGDEPPLFDLKDDEVKILVDAGLELATSGNTMLCQKISGEYGSDELFTPAKKQAERFKHYTERYARITMHQKINPGVIILALALMVFGMPIINAFMLRNSKRVKEKKEIEPVNIKSTELENILTVVNSKNPGRPPAAESKLREAYEEYKKDSLLRKRS